MIRIFILIIISFLYSFSEPLSKLKLQKKLLKGLSDKKTIIENKELIFLSKNKKTNPQDINWINSRLNFIYEINTLILDELEKVLDFDTDTINKDNTISLYLNPLINSNNPKQFGYYQEMNMINGDDIKYIFYSSEIIKKNGWPLDNKFSKNGIFSIWLTLTNNRFFDCKYQDDHIISVMNKLIENKEISNIGILFLSNIENPTEDNLKYIQSLILKENNPIWTKNLKYVKIIYKLNRYIIGLRKRKLDELKEENTEKQE